MRRIVREGEEDTAENRLKVTDFLIEATHNEWHILWLRWCSKSQECREPIFHNWEQLNGWLIQVGSLSGRPVAISLNWDRLDGFLVCQWEATSELVDYRMIREWLDSHFTKKTHDSRRAACNTSNFHHLTNEFSKWKPYPSWICSHCGKKLGRKKPGISTWHVGVCGVCGNPGSVTEPRDFGHLKDDWRNDVKSNGRANG